MTTIQDIFAYPIAREITTVVTMDDLRLQEVQQELEEYVVTDTIEELLIEFLEHYAETRTGQTKRIGVWISGFFGSGKSHFAKILSYLLENRPVGVQSALDLFKLRVAGSHRQREMERLLHQVTHFIDTEIIAFQIKTEEDLLVSVPNSPDAVAGNHISTIMYRQWLKKRGYSTTLWVARLELELTRLGQYQAFQDKVRELEGQPWDQVRQYDSLVRDATVKALCATAPDRYANEGKASKAIDDIQAGLQMGPSALADELIRWIEPRRAGSEKTPHLVYVIDEMGFFIGDDTQRLLEMQSIAEAFADKGLGKLWIIVTSQEALEEVVQGAIRHENEFDKIRDRFNVRLPLTSENTEKVLQERILKKKESKRPELDSLYHQAAGAIATVCTLQGANRPLPQPDAERFASDYPFPPYQLAVLQQIFAAVRTPGGEKEKIEGTERSLIGVTQAILKSPETGFAASPLGRLVALDEIYDQIETELPSVDRRTIDEVKLQDTVFLKRILKALYLVQKLEWVPCTVENLARLLVNHVDDPNLTLGVLKQQVELGLDQLEQGHYVIEREGQYECISGVKKDIEMEIAAVNVTVNDRRREIKKHLRLVLDLGRLNYQGIKRFDTVVRGDDEVISDKGEITLQVYSPIYVAATELTRDEVLQRSLGDERTLYWYPASSEELYREVGKLIQTESVTSRRMARKDKSPDEERVLYQKQKDQETSRAKILAGLRVSLLGGVVIYDGEVRDLKGRTSQMSTVFARELEQVIPRVYTRFEPAAVRVNEKSIEQILTATDAQLPDIETELELFDDACRLNRQSPVVNEMLEELRLRARAGDPCDGKTLSDFFESAPYGWDPTLVRIILAALFRAGVVSLKHEGKVHHDYKVARAQALLTKALDFRKADFVYDPQESLSPQERRQAQEAIDRIFNRREPDTVSIMAAALDEELNKLKRQNAEQRIMAQENTLPVRAILQDGQAAIEAVLSSAQPDSRLKAFLQQTSTIRMLKEYQDQLRTFIEARRAAEFRRARALAQAVDRARRIVLDLGGEDVQGWLDEMQAIEQQREIVDKWAAFYQNMQPLMHRYQAAYEAQHKARYEAYARVKAELDELGIAADSLDDRLCTGPVGWSLDGLTCTACGTGLETLYYQAQSASEEKARLVEQEARSKVQEAGEPEPQFVVVRLSEIIKTRNISTSEDLEAALGELRQTVQALLEIEKVVILG